MSRSGTRLTSKVKKERAKKRRRAQRELARKRQEERAAKTAGWQYRGESESRVFYTVLKDHIINFLKNKRRGTERVSQFLEYCCVGLTGAKRTLKITRILINLETNVVSITGIIDHTDANRYHLSLVIKQYAQLISDPAMMTVLDEFLEDLHDEYVRSCNS